MQQRAQSILRRRAAGVGRLGGEGATRRVLEVRQPTAVMQLARQRDGVRVGVDTNRVREDRTTDTVAEERRERVAGGGGEPEVVCELRARRQQREGAVERGAFLLGHQAGRHRALPRRAAARLPLDDGRAARVDEQDLRWWWWWWWWW